MAPRNLQELADRLAKFTKDTASSNNAHACLEMDLNRLVCTGPMTSPVLTISASNVRLYNGTLHLGPDQSLLITGKGVVLSNMTVKGTLMVAGNHTNSLVTVSGGELKLQSCVLRADFNKPYALRVTQGGTASVKGSKFTAFHSACKVEGAGSCLDAQSSFFQDCSSGSGLQVAAGGKAVAAACKFVRNKTGVTVSEAGSLELRDHCSLDDCGAGDGLTVMGAGSSATADTCTFCFNVGAGVNVHAGGQVALTKCTSSLNSKSHGVIVCGEGSKVQLFGCDINTNFESNVHVGDAAAFTASPAGETVSCIRESVWGSGLHVVNATATLTKCHISSNKKSGLWVQQGAHIEMADSTLCSSAEGHGVRLEGGGNCLEASACCFNGNSGSGIAALSGATVVLKDKCQVSLNNGHGVIVLGSLTAADCVIEGNHGSCVKVVQGGQAVLEGCKVRNSRREGIAVRGCSPGVEGGAGSSRSKVTAKTCEITGHARDCVQVAEGARFEVTAESKISGSEGGSGLTVHGSGSSAWASQSHFVQNSQHGVDVVSGGRLELEFCSLGESEMLTGLSVRDAGSSATAKHCFFTNNYNSNILVEAGAQLDLQGCKDISDSIKGCGLKVTGPNTSATAIQCSFRRNRLTNVRVTGGAIATLQACRLLQSQAQHGLVVEGCGTAATATACQLSTNADCGVRVQRHAKVRLLQCELDDNKWGHGLLAHKAGDAELEDCSARGNRWCSVKVVGAGSSASVVGNFQLDTPAVRARGGIMTWRGQ